MHHSCQKFSFFTLTFLTRGVLQVLIAVFFRLVEVQAERYDPLLFINDTITSTDT